MGAGIIDKPRISVPEPAKLITIPDLELHYKMNDNAADNTVVDSSDSAVDGGYFSLGVPKNTNLGSVAGKINTALSFDAVGIFVRTGQSYESVFQDSFSIEMWVELVDGQPVSPQHFFANSTFNNKVSALVTSAGIIQFNYEANGNEANYASANAVFPNGATGWYHLVFVADKTVNGPDGLKVYVNAIQETAGGTDGDTSGITFSDYSNATDMFFGSNDSGGSWLGGNIDDIRLYGKALIQSEIDALFNFNNGTENDFALSQNLIGSWLNPRVPNGQDYSPTGDDGYLVGAVGVTFDKYGIYNNMSGVLGGMELANALGTASGLTRLSFSAWVYKAGAITGDRWIFDTDGPMARFYANATAPGVGRLPVLDIHGNNGGRYLIEGENNSWEIGRWIHVGGVWRGGNDGDLYLDGEKVSKIIVTATTPDYLQVPPPLTQGRIGVRADILMSAWDGKIAGFEWYGDEVKSDEWYAQQYERGLV